MDMIDQIQVFGTYRFVAVAGVLLIALNWIRITLQDPFKHIPGPVVARFSRLWLLHQYIKGDYHNENIKLHRKHGPIVRIAPNQYSIDDISAAKLIYGHGTKFWKSDWYLSWGVPGESNLFKEVNPSIHASIRRKISSLYSMSSLVSYEPYVDECNSLFCDRLSTFAQAGAGLDMRHWFQCYAFDVIGLITLSKRFGTLDTGEDVAGFMVSSEAQLLLASSIGVFSAWYPLIFKLLTLPSTLSRETPGKYANIFAFVIASVEERRHCEPDTSGNGPQDFVGKFLSKASGEDDIDHTALISSAGANIGAGSDTTAITLTAILYYLCRSPEAMKKLRAELDLHSSATPLTFEKAQSLPYLQAVVKEALRMHPATGYTMPRVVPPGGVVIAGQFFPAGTVVGINSWVAHRNHSVFGEDADTFRPERWIEAQQNGHLGLMEAYSFAFGQGSRTCIGKNISLLEISKCIPRILQRFDFELADSGEPECVSHWFVKQKHLHMRIKERTK